MMPDDPDPQTSDPDIPGPDTSNQVRRDFQVNITDNGVPKTFTVTTGGDVPTNAQVTAYYYQHKAEIDADVAQKTGPPSVQPPASFSIGTGELTPPKAFAELPNPDEQQEILKGMQEKQEAQEDPSFIHKYIYSPMMDVPKFIERGAEGTADLVTKINQLNEANKPQDLKMWTPQDIPNAMWDQYKQEGGGFPNILHLFGAGAAAVPGSMPSMSALTYRDPSAQGKLIELLSGQMTPMNAIAIGSTMAGQPEIGAGVATLNKIMAIAQATEAYRNARRGEYWKAGVNAILAGLTARTGRTLGISDSKGKIIEDTGEKIVGKLKDLKEAKDAVEAAESEEESTEAAQELIDKGDTLKDSLEKMGNRLNLSIHPGDINLPVQRQLPYDLNNYTRAPANTREMLVPPPGQARAKSMNPTVREASINSVDRTLLRRPESAKGTQAIVRAEIRKNAFLAQMLREEESVWKGLSLEQKKQVGKILNGEIVHGAAPIIYDRARQAKRIFDLMYESASLRNPEDKIGYIDNYLTHIPGSGDNEIDEDLQEAINHIFNYHIGLATKSAVKGIGNKVKESTAYDWLVKGKPVPSAGGVNSQGDLYNKGIGNPSSPYVKERTDKLKSIEYDISKVLPIYTESMAKYIYDRPAVRIAKDELGKIPLAQDKFHPELNRLHDLYKNYITNYTRYDSTPGLNQAWNDFGSTTGRVINRNLMAFNPALQALHAARIVNFTLPELGIQQTGVGFKYIAEHPASWWEDTAKLGLLPQQIRPWSQQMGLRQGTGIFRKGGWEKFDSLGNYMSVVDAIDKTVAYRGKLDQLIKQGVPAEEASMQSLEFARRVSLSASPASPIPLTQWGEGDAGTIKRLSMMYKTVPLKIIEQYTDIANQARANPRSAEAWGKVAMALGTAAATSYAGNEIGVKLFHLDPKELATIGIVDAGNATQKIIIQDLIRKGDVEQAIIDTLRYTVPGENAAHKVYTAAFPSQQSNQPLRDLKDLKDIKVQ